MSLKEIVGAANQDHVVEVPLPEWRRALTAAVPPSDEADAMTLGELRDGALRCPNVPTVHVRTKQAQLVLSLIPVTDQEQLGSSTITDDTETGA